MKLFIIFVLLAKLITLLVYFYNRHEKAKEQAAREAEAARARAEMQRQRMVYQANIRRQQVIEREQARQAQEQARQAKEQAKIVKEQERQAKEQAKQAAILEKHEAEIRKAEYTFRQMKRKWEFLENRLAQQEAMMDSYLKRQESMEQGTKEFDALQKQIIVLDNQIYQTKEKFNKACFAAREAKRKLA